MNFIDGKNKYYNQELNISNAPPRDLPEYKATQKLDFPILS